MLGLLSDCRPNIRHNVSHVYNTDLYTLDQCRCFTLKLKQVAYLQKENISFRYMKHNVDSLSVSYIYFQQLANMDVMINRQC